MAQAASAFSRLPALAVLRIIEKRKML